MKKNPLLQGKRILLVSGWVSMKLAMFRHIHKMGVKIVVLDKPNPAIQQYVDEGLFESFIEADIDHNDQFHAVMQAIEDSGLTFDGVATLLEFYTPITARIAQALNLPGHSVTATSIARNKYETRKLCESVGIASPRFALIHSQDQLEEKAEYVGFPCVLKPSKGAGSTDVFYVYNQDELKARYQHILKKMDSDLHDAESVNDAVWNDGIEMILEEYLDGDEFDVDCLLNNGEMVFSSITSEKPQPHMIETGAYLPARYPQEKQDELIKFTQDILESLEFLNGVFHVELKYTSNGPRLIEINARVGGGPIYQMVDRVWGVDLIEQYLLTCLGIPIQPQKAPEPLVYIASQIIVAPFSGVVLRDDFLKHLQDDPRILFIQVYASRGQHIHGPQNRVPEWLAELIVMGDSPEKADEILQEIVDQIELPMKKLSTATWEMQALEVKPKN